MPSLDETRPMADSAAKVSFANGKVTTPTVAKAARQGGPARAKSMASAPLEHQTTKEASHADQAVADPSAPTPVERRPASTVENTRSASQVPTVELASPTVAASSVAAKAIKSLVARSSGVRSHAGRNQLPRPATPGPRARARALLMFTLRNAATWVRPRAVTVVKPVSSLNRRLETHEVVTAILSLVLSGATVLLTAKGAAIPMSETGAGAVDRGEALIFALGVGTASFLGYLWGFGVLTRLTGKRLAAGALVIGAYLSGIAVIDAPFNMLALAGGSAVQMSLVDTVACHETRRSTVTTNVTVIRRVLPIIMVQASQLTDRAKKERAGEYTGRPGEGKVSATAARLALLHKTLHDQLAEGLSRADAIGSGITTELAAMKRQAFTQGPIRDRAQAVSTGSDRIDELLGQMKQFDFNVTIKAAIITFEDAVVVPTKAANAVEEKQNVELTEIAAAAKTTARALSALSAELTSSGAEAEACPRPANAMDAIKTYWKPLLPQWVAALFLTLSQALIMAAAMIVRREPSYHDDKRGAS